MELGFCEHLGCISTFMCKFFLLGRTYDTQCDVNFTWLLPHHWNGHVLLVSSRRTSLSKMNAEGMIQSRNIRMVYLNYTYPWDWVKINLMVAMTNLSTTCIVTNPQGVANSVLPLSPTAECISALWYGCAVFHLEHFISLVLSHKDGVINHLHTTCWHQAADKQLDTSYRPYVAIF